MSICCAYSIDPGIDHMSQEAEETSGCVRMPRDRGDIQNTRHFHVQKFQKFLQSTVKYYPQHDLIISSVSCCLVYVQTLLHSDNGCD